METHQPSQEETPELPEEEGAPDTPSRARPDVVKWALGITTLVSVAYFAIDRLGSGLTPFAIIVGVMVLMVGLMLVSAVASNAPARKAPARVFLWSVTLMLIASIGLLGSILILRWPPHLAILVLPEWHQEKLSGQPLATMESYPVTASDDGVLSIDPAQFMATVDALLLQRNERAAAELIYLGSRNHIERRLSASDQDKYDRMINLYSDVVSQGIHQERDEVFETYKQIVDGVGDTFHGTGIEIVLHDTRDPLNSVVTVQNPITGRKKGSPTTNFGLELIRRYASRTSYAGQSYIGYELTLADGRRIKSTTIPIVDPNYGLIGFICINIDLTDCSPESNPEDVMRFIQAFSEVWANEDIAEMVEAARDE